MKYTKRDVVLWVRHLHERGIPLPPGRAAVFRLVAGDVIFEPMQPGRDGRATHGLRATGANRSVWTSIPLGTEIELEFVRLVETATAPDPADSQKNPADRGSAAPPMIASTSRCWTVDDVVRVSSKTTALDAYLAIDWSASSAPKTGKDNVWWCLCSWRDNELTVETNENPATRRACFDAVRGRLRDLLAGR